MLSLSICEIKVWKNSNCEFLQVKTFTVLAWFTTFELAVVLMQARTSTAFETLGQIRLFSASLNTKNDSRFHSGNFSKGKAILLCESELWTSWLQQFPYVRTGLLLSYLYSYHLCTMQNGFSVGNYSLKCSHISWNKSL